MKTLILISILFSLASCNGSLDSILKSGDSTAISVLRDDTDSAITKPSSELVNLYGMSDAKLREGYVYRDRAISDVSLNHVKQEQIKPTSYFESNNNSRIAELQAFKSKVIHYIDSLAGEPYKPRKNSLVYATITSELQNLQATGATNRFMVIYTDLLENSDDFSYYNKNDFEQAKQHPENVVKRFDKIGKMPDLTGVKIYVINNPHSYNDQKKFDVAVAVFKILVEQNHGQLIVASNITPEINSK